MDDILTYITDLFLGNGVIIILGCFVIGMFLKGSLKKVPNKYIPYINAIVAVILGFLIPGTFDDEPIVSKIIILAFLGLSSVGLYEALCTAVKDRFSIDIKKIYSNINVNTSDDMKDLGDVSSSQEPEELPHQYDVDEIIESLDNPPQQEIDIDTKTN